MVSSNDVVEVNCNPCLDRTESTIIALLPSTTTTQEEVEDVKDDHPTTTTEYDQIATTLAEVGRNMKINMLVKRPTSIEQMIIQLQESLALSSSTAIILPILNDDIQAILEDRNPWKVPIFGIFEGYERLRSAGLGRTVKGFVAMDDIQAGYNLGRNLWTKLKEIDDDDDDDDEREEDKDPSHPTVAIDAANVTLSPVELPTLSTKRILIVSLEPLENIDVSDSGNNTNYSYLQYQGLLNAFKGENPSVISMNDGGFSSPSSVVANTTTHIVEFNQLVLVGNGDDPTNNERIIDRTIGSCSYDSVVFLQASSAASFASFRIANRETLQHIIQSYKVHDCMTYSDNPIVTIGTTKDVYRAISRREVSFSISRDTYLQANLVATMASLYVTTGRVFSRIVPSSPTNKFGIYQVGGRIMNIQTIPNDQEYVCEKQGYPSCPLSGRSREGEEADESPPSSSFSCECRDRSQIRIAGIYHDDRAAAAEQAAYDLGITLIMDRVDAVGTKKERMTQLAEKIKAYCQDRVDGVFTQVKHIVQAEAIRFCQDLNVPVFGVLPVLAETEEYLKQPIHTIGMDEYQAGYVMAQELLERGMHYGYCVNWSGAAQLLPRCDGFEAAINASSSLSSASSSISSQYMGIIHGVSDNEEAMNLALEEAIGSAGGENWDGVGLLMTGYKFVSGGLLAQRNHPGLIFGTEGHSDLVYRSLQDGSLAATTDLQQYLRGYFPVALLTWMAQSRQTLNTYFLPSGPNLIFEAPSTSELTCMANSFQTCPDHQDKNQLEKIRPLGYCLLALLVVVSLICIGWVTKYRNLRVVSASQPMFMITICIGCIIMAFTILPLSFDDGFFMDNGGCVGCECEPCNVSCILSPWLFTTGFTIVFASLFSKIWRINRLMYGAQRFRRLKLTPLDVMKPFAVLLTLNVCFNLVWTLVDPMYYERSKRCDSDVFTSYGSCQAGTGAVSKAMASMLFIVNFCAVLMANYQAYRSRNLRTEFNESKYIAISMLCIFQVMVVGVPLMFLVTDSPVALLFVQVLMITIVCLSILVPIFLPKMKIQYENQRIMSQSSSEQEKNRSSSRSDQNSNPSGGGDIQSSARESTSATGSSGNSGGLRLRKRKITFTSILRASTRISGGQRMSNLSDTSALRTSFPPAQHVPDHTTPTTSSEGNQDPPNVHQPGDLPKESDCAEEYPNSYGKDTSNGHTDDGLVVSMVELVEVDDEDGYAHPGNDEESDVDVNEVGTTADDA